jgi:hypothetical protein
LIFFLIFISFQGKSTVFEQIEQKKMAVSLGKVVFFSDTILSRPTDQLFEEGELFEVLAESGLEHEDKDQSQKFKWYKVKAKNNNIGWIFGDAVALTERTKLPEIIQKINKKRFHFDNGFENAIVWVASINGTEVKTSSSMVNPFYVEQYLVITNENGNSVFISLSGQSIGGEYSSKSIDFQDVTNDSIYEIVLEKKNLVVGSPFQNRDLEIFSFQSGSLRKIFEERMTLVDGDDTPSPSLFKNIEISKENIRVAYVDFLKCDDYGQNLSFDQLSNSQERCLEYVTTTYSWDKNKRLFTTLYSESRNPLAVFSKSKYQLLNAPSDTASVIGSTKPEEELVAIKIFENFVEKNDKTEPDFWLYVKNSEGKQGYLPAYKIFFSEDLESAEVLHEYLNYATASRLDWSSEESFVKIVK